jgi:hypothetical protein
MARRRPVARVVPRRSLVGKLFVFAWERVGSLWRWRELTVPLALLCLAWAGGGDAAAVSAAVLLAGAAVLALALRPVAVLGAPRRCLERSRPSGVSGGGRASAWGCAGSGGSMRARYSSQCFSRGRRSPVW